MHILYPIEEKKKLIPDKKGISGDIQCNNTREGGDPSVKNYNNSCYLDATEQFNKLESLQNLWIRFIFGLRNFNVVHVSSFQPGSSFEPYISCLPMQYPMLLSIVIRYLRERLLAFS
ncbi:unnamed protein product [Euphydryas editha]|uniref:Uncharacterized protein n=1 Tax=Euphydryas editha TaxID=104508 RepID=A0AAU9TBS9_EUPED|nr:unnamed protein product [Euphydryas editha]